MRQEQDLRSSATRSVFKLYLFFANFSKALFHKNQKIHSLIISLLRTVMRDAPLKVQVNSVSSQSRLS